MYAEVVVNINNKAVDRIFDYFVPEEIQSIIVPGIRVFVPFGPRSVAGYVLKTKDSTEFKGTIRNIHRIMDVQPLLTNELIELGLELAKDTGSTIVACFDAMIPAAMKAKHKKFFELTGKSVLDKDLQSLFKTKSIINSTDVPLKMLPKIKKAIEDETVITIYDAENKKSKKMVRYAEIFEFDGDLALLRSDKQRGVMKQLVDAQAPVLKKDLIGSPGVLKALVDKRLIRWVDYEVYREPNREIQVKTFRPALNDEQQKAVESIDCDEFNVIMLHGITGSGKTEVYLDAIERVIAVGKEVLVLIPEITLTTQLTRRFKERFGSKIAIQHSGLSQGQRYDEWRKIVRKEVQIVIGARSAVFVPFTNIGLIIIDEEHEVTFKQDETPRYHAIEVAKKRGEFYNCPVVLGSATPSLESYARALKNVYTLVTLNRRAVNSSNLPEIELVNLNNQNITGNGNILSQELQNAISETLEKNEQVILFINRRGYSNYMQCRECSDVVTCPNCDVTLTYHKLDNSLKCHYCSHSTNVANICPSCESRELRFFGTGTQKIEEFLVENFENAKVLRMDVDSTSKQGSHAKIIKAFESKESNILLGTQMVAKGLDFPYVTLVGVLDSDLLLHFPDYKATERTFQILTQVAGRAGRHKGGAKVLIETYSPDHYVLQQVKKSDYLGFFQQEMIARRDFKYSPYFFHLKILLSSSDFDSLVEVGDSINQYLHLNISSVAIIIGPTQPTIARVNNRYRLHFIVKYKDKIIIQQKLQNLLEEVISTNVLIAFDYFPMFLS